MIVFLVVVYLTAVQAITPPVTAGLIAAIAIDATVQIQVTHRKGG